MWCVGSIGTLELIGSFGLALMTLLKSALCFILGSLIGMSSKVAILIIDFISRYVAHVSESAWWSLFEQLTHLVEHCVEISWHLPQFLQLYELLCLLCGLSASTSCIGMDSV